jgi:hypothetical protein
MITLDRTIKEVKVRRRRIAIVKTNILVILILAKDM